MDKPLVSIIITAYNCEKYIEESLLSIFNQTFKDFEIIIYNDGSTDKTPQVIIDFLEKNTKKINGLVNIIYGGKNVGCGEGRNRAISVSKSKYIVIQDADDISFPNRLLKEVDFLEKNNDIFCIGAWANKIKENGDFIETMAYPPSLHEEIYKEIIVKKNNPIIDPSCMYRRELFNKIGGYDSRWKLVPDFNLWVRAAQIGYKFANFSEPLVYYRQNPNSVTNKDKKAVIREHFKMIKEIF